MPLARFFTIAWSAAKLTDFDDFAPSKAMNDMFVPKYDSVGPDAPPASGCCMR
jgi:shikimate O-hydroxycinnamoyltransferase